MMLFNKFNEAFDKGDIVGAAECFHEDMQMTMHSNGTSMNKQEWLGRFAPMMAVSYTHLTLPTKRIV